MIASEVKVYVDREECFFDLTPYVKAAIENIKTKNQIRLGEIQLICSPGMWPWVGTFSSPFNNGDIKSIFEDVPETEEGFLDFGKNDEGIRGLLNPKSIHHDIIVRGVYNEQFSSHRYGPLYVVRGIVDEDAGKGSDGFNW